jgi:hypothetical protein
MRFSLVLMRFAPYSRSTVVLLLYVSMCVVMVEFGVYCSGYHFFQWWSYASVALMTEAGVVLVAWWSWWRRIW